MKDTIEEILNRVGEGKRWVSIEELLWDCEETIAALGPAARFAGGFFGWKFYELIPMLEKEVKLKQEVKEMVG